MIRLIALCATAALATGCVVRPVYDDSWAEQVRVESGDCPVIDGEYMLHVEATHKNGDVESFDLAAMRKCRNSTMLLRASWDGTDFTGLLAPLAPQSVPFVSTLSHTSLALGRAEDGSLLVRNGSTEGLFLLEWPVILGTDATWARFPPAPSNVDAEIAQAASLTQLRARKRIAGR